MKYLFLFFLFLFSTSAYSACEPDIHGVFDSTLSDPPYIICASSSTFGGSKCVMEVYNMVQRGSAWELFGKTTGQDCSEVTKLHPEPSQYECKLEACPVDEVTACPSGYTKGYYNNKLSCVRDNGDDTLQCSSDYCYNPYNLRCPSGYSSGSMSGNRICARNTGEDAPVPDSPQCENLDDGGNCMIVESVNVAGDKIVNAIDNQTFTLSDAIASYYNDITSYIDQKIQELGLKDSSDGSGSGSGSGSGNGSGEDGDIDVSDVDLSQLEGDLPIVDITADDKRLTQNLFNASARCPADNSLNLSFFGRSYTHTFKYSELCDGAAILGYFVMIFAYLFAARIIVRA